ncbi:acetate--CoA ligase, partial [Betaproteobacteria bacterium PRO7]|nr:acetate--CoA ligase [Betaproteobacteria bacterium PRO7]
MRPPVIRKKLDALRPPHLLDFERERTSFSWSQARAELQGLPGGALNIAHEAVERHARGARANRVALRWLGAGGDSIDFTYADLSALSNRFADALTRVGLARGDVLFLLAPRIPELYIAVLGALK